jgi:hypothetical protein
MLPGIFVLAPQLLIECLHQLEEVGDHHVLFSRERALFMKVESSNAQGLIKPVECVSGVHSQVIGESDFLIVCPHRA